MSTLDSFSRMDAMLESSQMPTSAASQTLGASVSSSASASDRHSATSASRPAWSSSFTTQVAIRPSTDFIRAASSAQAAVYNISQTSSHKVGDLEKAEVKRKMVGIATPLRKGIGSSGDRRGPRRSRAAILGPDTDPEVPLRAALKLVDMYPEAVPSSMRDEILQKISDAQEQASRIGGLAKPKTETRSEEDRSESLLQLEEEIRALEAEFLEMRRKTDEMMQAKTAKQFAEADESMASDGSPLAQHFVRRDANKSLQGDLASRLRAGQYDEDMTTDLRTYFRPDESLLMEGDTPDISQLMADTTVRLKSSGNWEETKATPEKHASQIAAQPTKSEVAAPKPSIGSLLNRPFGVRQAPPPRTPPRRVEEDDSFDETPRAQSPLDDSIEEDKLVEDTTILPSTSQADLHSEEEEGREYDAPSAGQDLEIEQSPVRPRLSGDEDELGRMRSFTMKLWQVVGDVVSPGHKYAIGARGGAERVPNLGETKAILRAVTREDISSDASPEATQRLLTATLLLHLLSRSPGPGGAEPGDEYSCGISEAKDLLNAVIEAHGWKKDLGTKVTFNLVAKKLVKSEGGRKLRCNLD